MSLKLVQYFSISVVHLCSVLFSICECVCGCLCVVVVWLVPSNKQATLTHWGHLPDMIETAQQPAGWWILATGVKFTGFCGVNMYNTRFLESWQGNDPRDKYYQWGKLTYSAFRLLHPILEKESKSLGWKKR